MNRMELDFQQETVFFDRDTQKGTEHSPDLVSKRDALLTMLGISRLHPVKVSFDFEAKAVSLQYSIPEVDEKEIYKLIDYSEVDMSNVCDIVNAYVNGQIPEMLFEKMMTAEGEQNEADPAIRRFLDMLTPPEEE